MKRRHFIRTCAVTAVSLLPEAFAAEDATLRRYSRSRLVGTDGAPLRASAIPPDRNLIFHYPYAATPCFLLNLGRPTRSAVRLKTSDQRNYQWVGGVGPQHAIVAYSAICAHQLAYPTRDISFISYRPGKTVGSERSQVIHCCAEHSQYDPAEGGRVLAGPANQPLAAIVLEHDARSDHLYAVGTLGGELFNAFFAKYEFRLAMERGGRTREAAAETCIVEPLEQFCRQQVRC